MQMRQSIARKVGENVGSRSRLVRASLPASFKNVQAIDINADKRAKRAPDRRQMHLIARERNASTHKILRKMNWMYRR